LASRFGAGAGAEIAFETARRRARVVRAGAARIVDLLSG
jgi:hypothetical protein